MYILSPAGETVYIIPGVNIIKSPKLSNNMVSLLFLKLNIFEVYEKLDPELSNTAVQVARTQIWP